MKSKLASSRRHFLRATLLGGVGVLAAPKILAAAQSATPVPSGTAVAEASVALTTGQSRADMAFRALEPFGRQVARAIGDRRVVIKPNNVSISTPLCATHAESIEGILEFLKFINKADQAVIAESAAGGATLDGFENYGYLPVANKYGVDLVDLDQEETEIVYIFDQKDFQPHAVRMSKLLLDDNAYVISAARMKTHDRVVATLSLKNIVFGAPIKDLGFAWGSSRKPGSTNDKPIAHGSGYRAINYNLFALAPRLHPDLAFIDGFEGMQGNGPVGGTPVDHRVCVASPDWLAADRVGIELMGIDFAKVGYLNYCAKARMGQSNLEQIRVLGPSIADHTKTYQLSDSIEKQLVWMTPAEV